MSRNKTEFLKISHDNAPTDYPYPNPTVIFQDLTSLTNIVAILVSQNNRILPTSCLYAKQF